MIDKTCDPPPGGRSPKRNGPRKRSRPYSRLGCQECKRRKLKCDEGKPSCFQCSHLGKNCVYQRSIKFSTTRQYGVEDVNFVIAKPDGLDDGPSKSKEGGLGAFTSIFQTSDFNSMGDGEPFGDSLSLSNASSDSSLSNLPSYPISKVGGNGQSGAFSQENAMIPPPSGITDFSNLEDILQEASLLVHDLNDMVNLDLTTNALNTPAALSSASSDGDDQFRVNDFVNELFVDHTPEAVFKDPTPRADEYSSSYLLYTQGYSGVKDLIDSFELAEPHLGYMELYISSISRDLFPFAPSADDNAVRDILILNAKNSPFLLASLLSIAATFQYNRTKEISHQRLRAKYLGICLKRMGEIFDDQKRIMLNIESLLLTVLVLTCDYSSTKGNLWKAHLRGAKDLLLKYAVVNEFHSGTMSPGLALARSWFAAIEILAGITYLSGGTIRDEQELNIMLDVCNCSKDGQILQRLGLLTPNGFNLFLGYSYECVVVFKELIKCIEKLRIMKKETGTIGSLSDDSIVYITALIHSAREFQVVDKSCIVKPNHPTHPEYVGSNKIVLPGSAYGFTFSPDGSKVVYSWFDISQQIHVDGAYLRVLATPGMLGLPSYHPLVQNLVKKILSYLFFIVEDPITHKYEASSQFDVRCIMLQWAVSLAASLTQDADDFAKVEVFLNKLNELGNGSSGLALAQIKEAKMRGTVNFEFFDSIPFS